MKRRMRRFIKWMLWTSGGVALVLGLAIAALAFPQPLFAYGQTFGEYVVRSDRPIPDRFESVIEDVRERVAMMENAHPGDPCHVFIFHNPKYYAAVAFLTRRTSNSMAIGLSAFHNVYIHDAKVRHMAAHNYGGIQHSRFEGNIAEVIAHEIAHFNVVNRVGYRAVLGMPVWKSEGWAEYQANVAATRADSSYVFADRVALFLDESFWGDGESVARWLFESHLLVEFLCDMRGMGLDDLLDETVTEADACRDMLAWYAERDDQRDATK